MNARYGILTFLYCAVALTILGQPPNPDPVLPPGFDLNEGKQPGLQRTPDHNLVYKLRSVIKHYVEKTGKAPKSWDDLEHTFGDSVWESQNQWNVIKRWYSFVTTEGSLGSGADGPIDGTLLLAPLYPIQDRRSKEGGRFTIWSLSNGQVVERWNTESELHTFSKWGDVDAKLEAAKAAVEQMPPLLNKSTPIPQPQTTSLIGVTPSVKLNTGQTPATPVEPRAPVWPWLVGIAALIAAIVVALKRRSS